MPSFGYGADNVPGEDSALPKAKKAENKAKKRKTPQDMIEMNLWNIIEVKNSILSFIFYVVTAFDNRGFDIVFLLLRISSTFVPWELHISGLGYDINMKFSVYV